MVNVVVDGEEGFGNLLHWNLKEILRKEFVLSRTTNNCSSCEKSGGHCGFENSEFISELAIMVDINYFNHLIVSLVCDLSCDSKLFNTPER